MKIKREFKPRGVRTVHGVTGHRLTSDYKKMNKAAEAMVIEACNAGATLSIGGAKGWDLEVMRFCFKYQVQYILRLAFKTRRDDINRRFIDKRNCILITWEANEWRNKSDNRFYFERNKKIVADARNSGSFYKKLHAFWDYRPAGGTFKCVEKAIQHGVLVTNWFDDKSLRTMDDLKGAKIL